MYFRSVKTDYFFQNKMSIQIPSPQYVKKPKNFTSHDCPTKTFHSRVISSQSSYFVKKKDNTIHLRNELPHIIPPHSYYTIVFDAVIVTSLPTLCILFSDDFLHRLGLSFNINILHTNDNYLHISLYNYSSNIISLKKGDLYVIGHIVLPKNPYHQFIV